METCLLRVQKTLSTLHRDESGQDLIEYALIAALIALGAVAGMGYVAVKINEAFSVVGNKLTNAVS